MPKSGYRFIGEVEGTLNGSYTEEITHVELEIEEESETRVAPTSPVVWGMPHSLSALRTINRYSIAATVALVCVIGAAFYFGWPSNSQTADVRLPQIDGRKTIAVMFFENQSNSAHLDWLREGLADMLVAGLARSEGLTVLGRGQLHDLLERGDSEKDNISIEKAIEIARQTQAEFFITGSFAQIGERVRLDVSLHDTRNGNLQAIETLTVEKADQLLTEIDLLSLKLSNRLNAAPKEKQDIASVMTDNLEAYRYYSLAVEKAQGYRTWKPSNCSNERWSSIPNLRWPTPESVTHTP